MTTRDSVALNHVLNADLDYMHSNGLCESKADFIHSVTSQKIQYLQMTPLEQKISQSRNHATIIGKCQVKGMYKGTAFELTLRYLSVYAKHKGKWQLQAWQSLKI